MPTIQQYRDAARLLHHQEGEIEIDNNAKVSQAEGNPDGGAYVQAWIWIADADVYEEEA